MRLYTGPMFVKCTLWPSIEPGSFVAQRHSPSTLTMLLLLACQIIRRSARQCALRMSSL